MADQFLPSTNFGGVYFDLNLKSVQEKQKEMGESEKMLEPEMISRYGAGELAAYYPQEEAVGRYSRPALTRTNAPAVTGMGAAQVESEEGGRPNYLGLGMKALDIGSKIGQKAFTGAGNVPTTLPRTSFVANEELYPAQPSEADFPSTWEGSIYGQQGATTGLGQSMGGGIGGLAGSLLGNNPAASMIGKNVGQVAGSMISGQALGLGSTFVGGLGTALTGQSNWTNPYSGYVESINSVIPILGTVLGGFIEGIWGKGPGDLRDIPEFTQAHQAGAARMQQLKDQGMTPYQIWQWANQNGYAVTGTEEGDIGEVLSVQEAMTLNQVRGAATGQFSGPGYYEDPWTQSGWGWGRGYNPEDTEEERAAYSAVYKTPEELFSSASITKGMSNSYGVDPDYLVGAPNRKAYSPVDQSRWYG